MVKHCKFVVFVAFFVLVGRAYPAGVAMIAQQEGVAQTSGFSPRAFTKNTYSSRSFKRYKRPIAYYECGNSYHGLFDYYGCGCGTCGCYSSNTAY